MALHLSGSISLTGSLTAGTSQTNTGTLSTIAGGAFNTVSGNCSFIGAGNANQATGGYSTAVGGRYSCALQDFAFVGGGCLNKACSCFSSVAGGLCNTVAPTSVRAFIGGGQSNTISSDYDNASIVAGICNTICGNENNSFIGGGANNLTKDSANSVIVGGRQNHLCSANYSTIAGGWLNSGSGAYSFIGGGFCNFNNSTCGVIVGGQSNRNDVDSFAAFMGAGCCNCITNDSLSAIIVGGDLNIIDTSEHGVIVGGSNNKVVDFNHGIVVGGCKNCATGNFASIVGGILNSGSGACSFIGSGEKNNVAGSHSSIVGGQCNGICGTGTLGCNIIGGGFFNRILNGSCRSGILGGANNTLSGTDNSFIIGTSITATADCTTYMNNLDVEGTVSASIFSGSFVGDGSGLTGISGGGGGGDYSPFITGSINSTGILPREGDNRITVGANATVAGGTQNTGSGQCAFIGGGELNYASTSHGAVVGGCKNHALSPQSAVVGGHDNHACANQSFIGAGRYNTVCGYLGAIVSGDSNCISSAVNYSFIGGGALNTASAHCSAILGGDRNYISSSLNNSFIVGSDITADKACYTFMNNLDVEGTVSASIFSGSFVGDGSGLTGISGGSGGSGDYSPFITGSVSSGILPTEGDNLCTIAANSTIAGGTRNTASAACSFIGAGLRNNITLLSPTSAIVTGERNTVSGSFNSAIVAGCCNILNSTSGYYGSADGASFSIIGSGLRNELNRTCYSAIVSGRNNCLGISTHCSFIGAGQSNTGSGDNSFIGTGCGNLIDTVTSYSSILNGRDNYLRASCSTIVGGCRNCLGCNINGGSTIAGGIGNHLFGDPGFIGAGAGNRIERFHGSNSIVGGVSNLISGSAHVLSGAGGLNPAYSFIGGGRQNTGSASYTFIGGGRCNIINSFSTGSAILGGHSNTVNHHNSFVVGSCLTSNEVCTTYMNNTVITGSLTVGQTGSLNSTVGRIDATNDIVAFSTSDRRLKENIQPIENALSKVIGVSGNTFDWKPLTEEEVKTIHGNTGRDVGVIAQEIEEILPEAVTTRDSGYKAVNYEKIVPLLIEAIKEQQKQIDELKSRL